MNFWSAIRSAPVWRVAWTAGAIFLAIDAGIGALGAQSTETTLFYAIVLFLSLSVLGALLARERSALQRLAERTAFVSLGLIVVWLSVSYLVG